MKKWKQTAGFTLVELIVVIAILGILAGVGTVGYSGYIKKANQAADNTLLGAVNTAFAAACIENGTTNTAQSNVALEDGVTIRTVSGTTDDVKIPASFEKYFAGNVGTLKYYKNNGDIIFSNGMFMAVDASGAITASWTTTDGQTFTLNFSNADVTNVNNSSFMNEGLGVETLLQQVNEVTELAKSLLGDDASGNGTKLLNGIITSPDFADFASRKLGGELDFADMATALKAYTGDPAAQKEIYGDSESGTPGWSDEKKAVLDKLSGNNLVSNALVLYAAEQSAGLSTDAAFLAELKNMEGMVGTTFGNNGKATTGDMTKLGWNAFYAMFGEEGTGNNQEVAGEAMAKAAYGYGMSIAYGNYKAQAGNSAVTWAEYLDSKQGQADFAAYASCMSMINSNATSSDTTAALLNAGFGDAALAEAIATALRGGN